MKDTSHLEALYGRLWWNLEQLAQCVTPTAREHRQRQIDSIRREIEGELRFLGMPLDTELPDMSDDAILNELGY